jgi:SAM-dependent methyltransferase
MNNHKCCPLCAQEVLINRFSTKDFFLTQEKFFVQQCTACGLLVTNPYPDTNESSAYYQSDKYYSHPGKKVNLLAMAYLAIRKRNIGSKTNLVKKYIPKGSILDIGCGSGAFLQACSQKGYQVTGIEKDNEARNYCVGQLFLNVVSPEQLSVIPENSQDIITMWHVLEHIHDLSEFIKKVKSWMKPGSHLILALPNPDSPDAIHYGEYWAGWDLPRHLYHFPPETVKFLGNHFGLQLVETLPMPWDAFYVGILSEQYKDNSMAPLSGLWQGLRSNIKAKRNLNYSSLTYIFRKPLHNE